MTALAFAFGLVLAFILGALAITALYLVFIGHVLDDCGIELEEVLDFLTGRPSPQVVDAERLLAKALSALEWSSGAEDFGPGGRARIGWDNIVAPVLELLRRRLERQ